MSGPLVAFGLIPVALPHFSLLGCHLQNGPSCEKTWPSTACREPA